MTSRSTLRAGFTLIEILMAVLLIGIVSVLSIEVIDDTLEEARFEDTLAEMKMIAVAMIGDPKIIEGGARTSFGFLGDIGAIPTAGQGIAGLVTNPTLPAWAVNSTARFGLGWNGPYLADGDSGTDYTTDAWGNSYTYTPGASPPTIVSVGANGAVGGTGFDSDITVALPNERVLATVTGYVSEDGAPFSSDAEVELNYPDGSGALTQSIDVVAPADNGAFSFASVPFGVRSISVYQPDKATATETIGPFLIVIDKPNFFVAPNLTDF